MEDAAARQQAGQFGAVLHARGIRLEPWVGREARLADRLAQPHELRIGADGSYRYLINESTWENDWKSSSILSSGMPMPVSVIENRRMHLL